MLKPNQSQNIDAYIRALPPHHQISVLSLDHHVYRKNIDRRNGAKSADQQKAELQHAFGFALSKSKSPKVLRALSAAPFMRTIVDPRHSLHASIIQTHLNLLTCGQEIPAWNALHNVRTILNKTSFAHRDGLVEGMIAAFRTMPSGRRRARAAEIVAETINGQSKRTASKPFSSETQKEIHQFISEALEGPYAVAKQACLYIDATLEMCPDEMHSYLKTCAESLAGDGALAIPEANARMFARKIAGSSEAIARVMKSQRDAGVDVSEKLNLFEKLVVTLAYHPEITVGDETKPFIQINLAQGLAVVASNFPELNSTWKLVREELCRLGNEEVFAALDFGDRSAAIGAKRIGHAIVLPPPTRHLPHTHKDSN